MGSLFRQIGPDRRALRPFVHAGILAGALLLAGCTADVGIPREATISCTADRECPGNRACNAAGLCVDPANLDFTTPELVSLSVTPPVANRHEPVEIAVEVDRPLDGPPSLTLSLPSPLTVPCTEAEPRHWSCPLAPPHDESLEGVVVFNLGLVDTQGNRADFPNAGSVRFDFTPPRVIPGSVTTVYRPPPDSLLPVVSALSPEGGMKVGLTLDEAVGLDETGAPRVTFALGTSAEEVTWPLCPDAEIGHSHVAGLDLEEGGTWTCPGGGSHGPIPSGTYGVFVTAEDRAGNVDTTRLEDADGDPIEVTVHASPPSAPDPADWVLDRVPYGRDDTGGTMGTWVLGSPGAAPPGARVFVLDEAGQILGSALVAADGEFPAIRLLSADRTRVWVEIGDDGGGRSPAVAPGTVKWTATLGGKRPRSLTENPTVFTTSSRLEATRDPHPQTVQEPTAEAMGHLAGRGGAPVERAGAPRWIAYAGEVVPPPRFSTDLVFEHRTGRALLFGGAAVDTSEVREFDDTWVWTPAAGRWQPVEWEGPRPRPRRGHRLVYEGRRDAVYLVGGGTTGGGTGGGGTAYDELWRLDLSTRTAQLVEPPDDAPAPDLRGFGAAVYDPVADVLLFYGSDGAWRFHPSSESWSEVSPGEGPWPGTSRRIVFDPSRSAPLLVDEDRRTWAFEGDGWTLLRDSDGLPQALGALTYDSASDTVVGVAGWQVWRFDGADWSPDAAPEHAPTANLVSADFSPTLGRLVALCRDGHLHVWTGTHWRQRSAGHSPPFRADHQITFDPIRGHLIHSGGSGPDDDAPMDMLAWAGTSGPWWPIGTLPDPVAFEQTGRWHHEAVFDSVRDRLLVYGGSDAGASLVEPDLLIWDPACAADPTCSAPWTRLPGPTPRRAGHGMAYDPETASLVVFGGWSFGVLGDLWRWDGDDWLELSPPDGPGPRSNGGFAFHPPTGRFYLHGGRDASSQLHADVWSWDPVTTEWALESADGAGPPPRWDAPFVHDPSRDRFVVFGVVTNMTPLDDLWEWNPATGHWTERFPDIAPANLTSSGGIAYDPISGHIVRYGGWASAGAHWSRERWGLDAATQQRPAAFWRVPFAAADIPPDRLDAIVVRVRAAGVGEVQGEAVGGFALHAWDLARSGWSEVGAVTSPFDGDASEIQEMEVHLEGDALARLLQGGQHTFHLALTPIGSNGTLEGEARIAVDYLEVVGVFLPEGGGG